jgi:hypothetical protein
MELPAMGSTKIPFGDHVYILGTATCVYNGVRWRRHDLHQEQQAVLREDLQIARKHNTTSDDLLIHVRSQTEVTRQEPSKCQLPPTVPSFGLTRVSQNRLSFERPMLYNTGLGVLFPFRLPAEMICISYSCVTI